MPTDLGLPGGTGYRGVPTTSKPLSANLGGRTRTRLPMVFGLTIPTGPNWKEETKEEAAEKWRVLEDLEAVQELRRKEPGLVSAIIL